MEQRKKKDDKYKYNYCGTLKKNAAYYHHELCCLYSGSSLLI